jgi:putative tricarboxylic transport membrane protein
VAEFITQNLIGANMSFNLDRWIAIVFLLICLLYGYTAFLNMDGNLPPFMQRNPIWPSTLPKLLSIIGIIVSMVVIYSKPFEPGEGSIDYRRLGQYKLFHAIGLMGLMVLYAVCLRPMGFLFSTAAFLLISGYILGERKLHILAPVAILTSIVIWYLVQEILGIFLRPLPWFLGV